MDRKCSKSSLGGLLPARYALNLLAVSEFMPNRRLEFLPRIITRCIGSYPTLPDLFCPKSDPRKIAGG